MKAFAMVDSYIDLVEKNKEINPKQDASVLEAFLMNLLDKLADSKTCQKVQVTYDRLFRVN